MVTVPSVVILEKFKGGCQSVFEDRSVQCYVHCAVGLSLSSCMLWAVDGCIVLWHVGIRVSVPNVGLT